MDGLDPDDWSELRALGHRMVDDMIDHLRDVRNRPVWRKLPDPVRAGLRNAPLPRQATTPTEIYRDVAERIVPYVTGNTHPRFMGWVHGGGNAVGMLAELLAAGLNANCGGRDHAGIEVERAVIAWAAEIVGMPPATGGLLVTGSSMANLIAVLVARFKTLGPAVRTDGIGTARLTAYAAVSAHGCIPRALDMAGLGTDALSLIGVDGAHRIEIDQLAAAIARDRAEGKTPFMVVGTAGTVDCGATDDLEALADLCERERLWFHVDGAFGALAVLSPRHAPALRGIGRADSLAFDFHKWAQVPYDAGCVLIRDAALQAATFAQSLAYLARDERGLAGNAPWPCDLGPDLSRGFRALKIFMTLQATGTDGLADIVERCCDVARHLAARIGREPTLELAAPVALNIVCFRIRNGTDRSQSELVADLQESGIAAPSTTTIDGRRAIRAAIVNHRTTTEDADILLDAILSASRA
jgi:glutamate/tyrosine decarboxylase-like PLP-dependent enzyme